MKEPKYKVGQKTNKGVVTGVWTFPISEPIYEIESSSLLCSESELSPLEKTLDELEEKPKRFMIVSLHDNDEVWVNLDGALSRYTLKQEPEEKESFESWWKRVSKLAEEIKQMTAEEEMDRVCSLLNSKGEKQ